MTRSRWLTPRRGAWRPDPNIPPGPTYRITVDMVNADGEPRRFLFCVPCRDAVEAQRLGVATGNLVASCAPLWPHQVTVQLIEDGERQ